MERPQNEPILVILGPFAFVVILWLMALFMQIGADIGTSVRNICANQIGRVVNLGHSG